ncbi:hypothetical protein DY000_02031650 [Brassica cretica]|uniref:Uncharacterized protein n=1 Tax=Brassica cretica TaxID=69181 RepID=A0ABQ7DET4_BRACR|nr:hypothetical protein DY000_02031650 [Brassica cretica]
MWATRPESKSCRPLKYKIKVPNPTRSPSNRSITWKYSSRPRSTIWKNDSPPGKTMVSIHPHEEVLTPTPTTKLQLRPLLLSLTPDQTLCSPWFLLVPGPIPRSNFLQSLVPADSGSYPQITLSAVHDQTFCSPWFLLVPGPILRSDPRSLWICRFRVPKQSQCLQLLTPAGSGSSLHNKSQQHSDPMGAAITAVDDIHTSILITPPHMRKMQGSQAGHNIFRPGLQFGQILKTGGVKRRISRNTAGILGNH